MASRGRRKSVGVVEMARDLGVSTATVSRALNGSPSVRRDLVGTRIAGLVISPSTHVLDDTRRLLAEFPVVELHRVSGIDAPSVFSDDEQALTNAILHPARLGHTGIAYLGTPRELSNGATRLRGIRRGVAQAGLDPRRITIRLVEPTQENGGDVARELVAGNLPFTALVVGSGSLSVGAARQAAVAVTHR